MCSERVGGRTKEPIFGRLRTYEIVSAVPEQSNKCDFQKRLYLRIHDDSRLSGGSLRMDLAFSMHSVYRPTSAASILIEHAAER